jgi:signal transduction histidine kinase
MANLAEPRFLRAWLSTLGSRGEGVPPNLELQPDFDQAFAANLEGKWIYYSKFSAGVSIVLVPLFALLDWLVYPAEFISFLQLRVLCAASILIVFLVSIKWARRLLPLAAIGSLFLVQILVAWMIGVTDGEHSGYYAGLNLPIIGMGFFLPTVLLQTSIFCVLSLLLYTGACLYAGGGELGIPYIENCFFFVATGLMATYATWFLHGRRRTEFTLSYELAGRIRELHYLNRKRTDFFNNISHELRTPLTLILAPVQEILSEGVRLPDALAGRLMVVRDNGLRLLKLVNELLDIVRLEENVDSLRRDPIDANGIVRSVVDSMLHLAEAKGLQLSKDISTGDMVVKGDQRALEKIFVNLVGNAIKFTESGGCISVRSFCQGNWAIVEVQDSGIGIARSEQGHIFERFRQADSSSTRRYRGTGLGLALVKEMTERMGGSVSVESEPGRGTTMKVQFPLSDEAPLPDEEAGELDVIQAVQRMAERQGGLQLEFPVEVLDPTVAGGEERPLVLVVEDEPDMRRYLCEILGREYQVVQARDGREGLLLALERDPDLILLDLMLPEMDGLEVCRRIRRDEKPRFSRIMLLTARADEQSKLTALENGANDFLTKPFSTIEVLTRLRNLLENAHLERDLAARNARLEQTLRELEATQAQLIQSEKLNALGSLSAGLLHEINNPLNYSLTALQLLSSDPSIQGDELTREILGDIREGMDRIRAIVSDLHAFAYPTAAEKVGAFDFNEAVEAALRFTAHELKGIEVSRCLPKPAWVLGSKSHLTQVLINIIANAAKAVGSVTEDRIGTIRIEGEAREGRFWVRVLDNGVGMDEQTLGRIFDPFFTTRDVGEGMGLGLSVCHTIVTNHGGRLIATSRPDQATELSFDLSLAEQSPTTGVYESCDVA